MNLFAISDLHVSHPSNRRALDQLVAHEGDWLIVAGDTCETAEDLASSLSMLQRRFARVIWVPGNHELWTLPNDPSGARGEDKYRRLVEVCARLGVVSPEDPYPTWPGDPAGVTIAPLFLLYDYSFCPPGITPEAAVSWAAEAGLCCTDEYLIHPQPFASIPEWCRARCEATYQRLLAIPPANRTVLVNHFPLRQDLIYLPRIPRFSVWCGTRQTEDWHVRFRALCVVSGHLHVRQTQYRDGVRFEEVSLGYPRQWREDSGIDAYLRKILPEAPLLRS